MQVVSRSPHDPRLRGLVRVLWRCHAPGCCGRERMLPSGLMQLIVNLRVDAPPGSSKTFVQGMQSRAWVLDRQEQRSSLGVVFEPGAGRVLLGTPLDALSDARLEFGELDRGNQPQREYLLDASSDDERFDRLERWLVTRIRGEVDPTVRAALALMRRSQQRVAAMAATLGTSERALRRRFRAEVGLPPKQMSRVLRLQKTLEGLRGCSPLAKVALSSGYHDQAHMTHELQELAGVSPSTYRRSRPVHRNHLG